MLENVSKFEIPVHDFAFDEGLEGVQDLYEVLKSLFLREFFLGLDGCEQIALVAELEDEIDVVDSLLDVNEPDDIIILTTLQHLNLVLQQLRELAYVSHTVTLDLVPPDRLHRHVHPIHLRVPPEDVPELTTPNLGLQHINVHRLRHSILSVISIGTATPL